MKGLAARYEAVQERIAAAAQRAGRRPEEITLVAVTKTWPAETIEAAYEAGMRHFGENRIEEMAEKQPAAAALLGDKAGLTWHQIGPLQSRKTNLAADHADVFHALDRLKIARRLSTRLEENGRRLPLFIEVNVSGEASKAGFDCSRWEEDSAQREKLQAVAAEVIRLPGLQLIGLMTMAPWDIPAEEIRLIFRRTRLLRDWLESAAAGLSLLHLSMGMSDDFELAIEEGATYIRVGRAIFGPR